MCKHKNAVSHPVLYRGSFESVPWPRFTPQTRTSKMKTNQLSNNLAWFRDIQVYWMHCPCDRERWLIAGLWMISSFGQNLENKHCQIWSRLFRKDVFSIFWQISSLSQFYIQSPVNVKGLGPYLVCLSSYRWDLKPECSVLLGAISSSYDLNCVGVS